MEWRTSLSTVGMAFLQSSRPYGCLVAQLYRLERIFFLNASFRFIKWCLTLAFVSTGKWKGCWPFAAVYYFYHKQAELNIAAATGYEALWMHG